MHPILFSSFGITIHTYGMMVALGSLCGIALALYLAHKDGLDVDRCIDLSIYVLVSSIVGARILYVIAFWDDYKGNVLSAFMLWQGGLVFYGGLICAILVLSYFTIKYKMSLWRILDVATPGTALALAIGRLGCFFNGCCYGVEASVPWAVHFPELPGLRHPTQLYEFTYVILLLAYLLYLWHKRKYFGQVFIQGLMFYSVLRFANEALRVAPHYWLNLSGSQWISICLFLAAWIVYYIRRRQSA